MTVVRCGMLVMMVMMWHVCDDSGEVWHVGDDGDDVACL